MQFCFLFCFVFVIYPIHEKLSAVENVSNTTVRVGRVTVQVQGLEPTVNSEVKREKVKEQECRQLTPQTFCLILWLIFLPRRRCKRKGCRATRKRERKRRTREQKKIYCSRNTINCFSLESLRNPTMSLL